MKLLFLIADGMGDWPLDELGGRTPLEAAKTPNMDALANSGLVGTAQTVPQGMPPGSDVANMALLGFDPASHHTGRGPIEAAAQGLVLDPEDLIWRLNLVTVSKFDIDGLMRDYSAGHIATEQATALINGLQTLLGGAEFDFYPGVQYRHLLVQKGGAQQPEAKLLVRPPHDITDKPIKPDLKTLSKSALLWDVVHEAVEMLGKPGNKTKANAIWPWGQGRPLNLPDFREKTGLRGAVISAVDLIKGLGRAAGMEVIDVEGATGLLDTNYQGKVDAALEFLETGDFVFVHLEGPDECGHGGNALDKMEAISRFDARVVGPLLKALEGRETAWLTTCDHFTPIVEKTHTTDAVPFILNYPGCKASGLDSFSEKNAVSTGLALDKGHELMKFALEKIGLK